MDRICGPVHPHKIRTDNTNIAIPTGPKPMVLSCHGVALSPTPVIGGRLLAPTTAANVVMIRLSNRR